MAQFAPPPNTIRVLKDANIYLSFLPYKIIHFTLEENDVRAGLAVDRTDDDGAVHCRGLQPRPARREYTSL